MILIFEIFFKFFEFFLSFFEIFQLQGSGNLLYGVITGLCIVSSNNGLVFNILMSHLLALFLIKSAIF